jgi:glutamate synthase (NADPH/NADH) small chain
MNLKKGLTAIKKKKKSVTKKNWRSVKMKEIVKTAVPMREQPAGERIKNFDEVPFGYNEEEAIKEASRCLQCKNRPCVSGCPVAIRIPDFIKKITERDFQKAIDIIHETDSLPCITGRVCPQEEQCQAKCVVGKVGDPIMIGRLERFVADWELKKGLKIPEIKKRNEKVAIVGSGPAGLACAGELAIKGFGVTVFEAFHELGGVLTYGIPEFRLPKEIVKAEIERLKMMGVEFKTDMLIGRTLTINDLFELGYSAIFIGVGAGLPRFMNIPGENLIGIYSANEFLTRINLLKAYKFGEYDTPVYIGKRACVVGGGNVAMDAARTLIRLGPEKVYLIYRRTIEEMPARKEEIHHALEEGIEFLYLTNPVRFIGDENGHLKAVECVKMKLSSETDESGRKKTLPIPGSEFILEVDEAIIAIGTKANPLLQITTQGLKFKPNGQIEVDEYCRTSLKGVFAGGDIVNESATVVTAMGDGRRAAMAIEEYINTKKP